MLTCTDLTFGYRRSEPVLERFSASFPSGVNIILGPNGAGKSTLMSLMASVRLPQRGVLRIGDMTLQRQRRHLNEWRRRIGWVPQQVHPVPGMSAVDQVAYHGWLKGVSRRAATAHAREALALVGLTRKEDHKVTTLSGGQLRRLGIACALVHDSDLVLMDEPTAGLDPQQRARLHEVIRGMDHVNWIISTHQTEDLPVFSDHVSVLAGGQVVFAGSTADFLSLGQQALVDSGVPTASSASHAAAAYASLVGDEE